MGNNIGLAEGAAPEPEEQAAPETSDEVLDSGEGAGKEAEEKPVEGGEGESKEEGEGDGAGDGAEGGEVAGGEEGGQEEGEEGGGEEAGEGEEEEEEEEEQKVTVDDVKTAPLDLRFPTVNQAKHCYTRYNEFHKCAAQKGEDAPECAKYARYYRSLCPGDWIDKWNEEREMGTFVGRY